ncbi:hypothetical protein OIDMADRAFT_51242 [Oidiodendron maius Zn]|uniref:CmcJ-like methyltransferase n=1 Tax=Oidiodendron maius (strain Zn) TaxID=913774 RepID=A0A0C3HB06_OIDMZ|nr:hypothetical protein OIDMADRAFT_51242 [Oidiodendron maius Zn]
MISDTQPPHNINSTIAHLARDLRWTREKPYIADFAVPKGAALSNHIIQKCPVTIWDLRDSNFRPTLAENGFCLVTIPSNMTAAEALENPRQCEEMYFGEIRAAMHRSVCLTDRYLGPKAGRDLPLGDEIKLTKHEQPSPVAHTDYSLAGALMELPFVYPGQQKYFEDRKFDILNVWRPLKGPNDDWPLALCDAATIANEDIRESDVVHYNRIFENTMLHPSKNHRWYYLSNQAADECFVFRNVGSDPGSRSMSNPASGKAARNGLTFKGAFHAAFDNPRSTGEGRISAEVRVLGFY